ncbi:hypothetical protein [Methanogenium organophilum]|uniref:Uncharacterized protein n=1 Tax=Methanogenium organophilum TaxID=2199 RepID=A0A9X9S425_METOG|nr:hypothetical protein [Methanogenium organophilum]WAI00515.1 hypothetical protein OU421_08745 [Methanogenium organophilum]
MTPSDPVTKRIGIAFAFLVLFAGGMYALQIGGEEWVKGLNPDTILPLSDAGIQETFYWNDFNYGPQEWRPFKEPLNISNTAYGDNEWYLMFVKANATPYGGNPALHRRGNVQVNYSFTNLAGTAAFHVIGFDATAKCRTNKQDGYGASSYFVTGDAEAGTGYLLSTPMTSWNNVPVLPPGEYDTDEGAESFYYFIHFDPLSGGDGAVHITDSSDLLKGEVIETDAQSGEFYVTHTGGSLLDDILLVVCVSEVQPDDFSLDIETSFVRRE